MDKSKATPVMTPNPKAGSSIHDLLFLAHTYEENGEYDVAKLLYERASTSFEGMINYAHFLLNTQPWGEMNKQQQIRNAERMLIYVERNGTDKTQLGRACMMLADLYRYTNAIRSLGYYMRANRYGKNVDPNLQTQLLKRVAKMEIAEVERDVSACYIVGTEFVELIHDLATMKWAMTYEISYRQIQRHLSASTISEKSVWQVHTPRRDIYSSWCNHSFCIPEN